MSVMVVDDSVDSRRLIGAFLESDGYAGQVTLVGSAREAFQHLAIDAPGNAAGGFDLILMDIAMPEVDGVEACRRIKAVPRLQDIPIIMVTGHDDEQDLIQGFAAGAMDYLIKPVKKVPRYQDIPIIMVTSHDSTQYLDEAFAAGAMDYITKPVNRAELGARVSSALALRREVQSRKRAYAGLFSASGHQP